MKSADDGPRTERDDEPWLHSVRTKAGFEARRILAQGKKVMIKLRIGQRWQPSDERFTQRVYPSYEAYLSHQRTKLDALRHKSIAGHDQRFYDSLRKRLQKLPLELERRAVLCLAARQGTEVRAFIDEGAFAVGIDLNPGRGNRYVVVGDFHDLQFATGSVELVFTNSLDHAFDLNRILNEVHRVLVNEGFLLVEVGEPEGRGFYESLSWSSVDDLLGRIQEGGFQLEHRERFELPWIGEQLLLRKVARTGAPEETR